MLFFNLFNAFYTGYLSRTEFLTDKGWDRLWKISIVFIAAQIAVTTYNVYRLVVLMLESSKAKNLGTQNIFNNSTALFYTGLVLLGLYIIALVLNITNMTVMKV